MMIIWPTNTAVLVAMAAEMAVEIATTITTEVEEVKVRPLSIFLRTFLASSFLNVNTNEVLHFQQIVTTVIDKEVAEEALIAETIVATSTAEMTEVEVATIT